MKSINKILAYSVSSLWLSIIITLSINYHILTNAIFWTISLTMCLPVGMVFEGWYSFIYRGISVLATRINFNIPHKIACKRYLYYKENFNNFESVNYLSNSGYQQVLSENNVLRNLWLSSFFGLIFIIIFYSLNINNSVSETKILIWLPIIIPLVWFANIRTEILLKKIKGNIYHFTNQTKDKRNEELSYEYKNS